MVRRMALAILAVLFVASLALAGEAKEASGSVKAVTGNSLTVTDAGKDMDFVVDKDTLVLAKGASHKAKEAQAEGKETPITEYVKEKQSVVVKYVEQEGKLLAKEIRVVSK